MRLLAALGLAVGSLALGTAADASCRPPEPLPQRIARADAVVWDTVVAEGHDGRSLLVQVQTVYKGVVPEQITVIPGPDVPGVSPGQRVVTSVDYAAARGTSHTFYLQRHSRGGFSTDACNGSHEGGPTPDELAAFETPRAPDRVPGGPERAPDRAPGGVGSATDADRLIAAVVLGAALGATFYVFRHSLAP